MAAPVINLRSIQREFSAMRRDWISLKGYPRRSVLHIYNQPDGSNDRNINVETSLNIALSIIVDCQQKVNFMSYSPQVTVVGLFHRRYKTEVTNAIKSSQPSWTVIDPVLETARIYFFLQLADDVNDLEVLTHSLMRSNNLMNDGSTQVISIDDGPNGRARVTMRINRENRERLLDQDGIIKYLDKCTEIYDYIGLECCERCHSYEHSDRDCTELWTCLICLGHHNGTCPFQRFPGRRRCASCPEELAGDHETYSRKCPTLIHRVSQRVQGIDMDYRWVLVPPHPNLY